LNNSSTFAASRPASRGCSAIRLAAGMSFSYVLD
jgi:hypothetical protein